MKIILKGEKGLVTQSDNTRVAKPIIQEKVPYKLKSNEVYFIDKKTGKKTLIKQKQETVSTDKRSTYQRKQDQIRTKQIQKKQEADKNYEKGLETISTLSTLAMPSTYIGPAFNNNGKSYVDNVISGEGTGNVAGNLAIDLAIPFGLKLINKGFKTGSLGRYKEVSNKYAVGDYIDGSTFSDDYPIYDALKGSNIYHEFTPPFFEQKIGNKNVVLLGLLDPGNFSKYWGERIIENMRLKGFNPDEISHNLVHNGIRTIGRPSQLIRSKAAEPIYIYTTPEKTNITGFYNSPSGRAFARISPKTTKEKLRSTTIHENVSHGTDAVVNTATRGAASREYQKITDNVSKKGLATIEGSEKWYELRSTMAQFMRKMYNNYRRVNPGARYEDLKDIVNKEVDRMSLQETSEMLSKINGYGQNYAEYLKQNPFELNKFKELLKYGMGISAPIGITNYGFKNK